MRRPIMDPGKAPCAAVTMVKGDYFFLKRWLEYYGAQVGREHLYVLSHGNDPEIRRIAAGANVINVPYDASRTRFDQRRWQLLAQFAGGLLRYFNWVICGDVDEFVVADPDVASGLLPYLAAFPPRQTPAVICPLALEIVHNPVLEPGVIRDDAPVLTVRRLFRLNANYSKPCIIRTPVQWSPGGHSCSWNDRTVDPHLYLIHMRYVSHDVTLARLEDRRRLREAQVAAEGGDADAKRRSIWEKDAESYLALSQLEPVAETVDFPDFRRAMVEKKREVTPGGHWFFGGGRSKVLYRLPERFTTLV